MKTEQDFQYLLNQILEDLNQKDELKCFKHAWNISTEIKGKDLTFLELVIKTLDKPPRTNTPHDLEFLLLMTLKDAPEEIRKYPKAYEVINNALHSSEQGVVIRAILASGWLLDNKTVRSTIQLMASSSLKLDSTIAARAIIINYGKHYTDIHFHIECHYLQDLFDWSP